MHVANNALVWLLAALDSHHPLPVDLGTVAQLRAAWWLPVLGLAFVVPWAIRARGRYGPISAWRLPPSRGTVGRAPEASEPAAWLSEPFGLALRRKPTHPGSAS